MRCGTWNPPLCEFDVVPPGTAFFDLFADVGPNEQTEIEIEALTLGGNAEVAPFEIEVEVEAEE